MPKCVYCGKMYEPPRGVTIVTNKGDVNHLCSSKCRKNMAMGRRKVRWVKDQKPVGSKKSSKKTKTKTKAKSRKKKR